jgi:phosphoesterase RecJ-like protein
MMHEHAMNEIHRYIHNAQQVALLTHPSPDGDAMGSSLAMYHYVRSLGKQAQVIVPNAFPEFLAWLPGAKDIMLYDSQKNEANQYLEGSDLVICTDFNNPSRIGCLGDKLMSLSCPKLMIDHHLHPSDFAQVMISVPEASSTCELVYEVLAAGACEISPDIATCLYTGLMTDTGNFSYNSNRPQIYSIISALVAAGANKDEIYNAVFNQYSVDRIKLVGYCLLKKMRVFAEHHTALIYLSRKELYKFNFQSGDAEGIVNMPLQSKDIYYSVFMREDKATAEEMAKNGGIKTKIKVSLRSQGDRPVNIFARDVFNGGGHANASGGEHYGSLEEAVQKFLDNYTKYFKK